MTNQEMRSIIRIQLSNELPGLFPRPELRMDRPSPYEGSTSSCGSGGRGVTPHATYIDPIVRQTGFVFLTGSDRRRRGGVRG